MPPSHTAVDEALEGVAEQWQAFHDGSGELADAAFVRVLSGNRENPKPLPNVEYRSYYDNDDVSRVAELLFPHRTDTDADPEHVLLFTTTTSLRGVIDKVGGLVFGADGAEDVMEMGASFVNLLAIDGASMLDLPGTLLTSPFLRGRGQTLMIGGHRQMDSVQQHEWDGEDRRTIEENVPFMSTLNFVRFLRGDPDEVNFAVPDSPAVGDAIPVTRLDRTYPKIISDFLNIWILYSGCNPHDYTNYAGFVPHITNIALNLDPSTAPGVTFVVGVVLTSV